MTTTNTTKETFQTGIFMNTLDADSNKMKDVLDNKIYKFQAKCSNRRLAYDLLGLGDAYAAKKAKRAEIVVLEKDTVARQKVIEDAFDVIYKAFEAAKKENNAAMKELNDEFRAANKVLTEEYQVIDKPLKEARSSKEDQETSKFNAAMEMVTNEKLPGALEAIQTIKATKKEAKRAIGLAATWAECVSIVNAAREKVDAITII
jgi:hypothetical protein